MIKKNRPTSCHFSLSILVMLLLMTGSCTQAYLPVKSDEAISKQSALKEEEMPPAYLFTTGDSFDSPKLNVNEYMLDIGDEIEVKYFYHPHLNERLAIRPDGKISLMLAEEITARGMTIRTLDEVLTKKYENVLSKPEVTIILRHFAEKNVYVSGELLNPGKIVFHNNLTLMTALSHAGGLKNTATTSQIILVRRGEDNRPVFVGIDYKKMMSGPYKYFYLRPYDVIFVPRSAIANLNLLVDQYVNKMIPDVVDSGFYFMYNLNPVGSVQMINE